MRSGQTPQPAEGRVFKPELMEQEINGRRLYDRRKQPTNPLSRTSLSGRRQSIRRAADRQIHYYVDRYGPGPVVVFLLVVLLSIADAFITLWLVDSGGRELNPLMSFMLSFGATPFLLSKYLLTGGGILFLLVHKEYPLLGNRWRGIHVMLLILAIYVALICYELTLLT